MWEGVAGTDLRFKISLCDYGQKGAEGKGDPQETLVIDHLPLTKAWLRDGAVEVMRRSEVLSVF